MRHFGQWVGLVHELRQLRRAEEFAHRSHSRFRIDQIIRHDSRYIDARHALLNGALHPKQANTILVLQKLTNRTNAAVTKVIDIIDIALAVFQIDQFLDYGKNVFFAQRRNRVFCIQLKPHVELNPANSRQIITLAIEEQAFEQSLCGFLGRRLTWTHDLIDRL